MPWEVDQKLGIATLGKEAEIHSDGTGRIKLVQTDAILAQPMEPVDGEGKPYVIDGDYLIRDFRILSAILIQGYWIDFTDVAVLKKAVSLFDSRTLFTNHWPDINSWVGVVTKPRFTESKGVPGVDGTFKVDMVKEPNIARGMMMDPPAIHSCSAEVRFSANRSHPDMGSEFWSNLGREVDGQIVRFIVTKITAIPEISLVYAGADPNARALSLPGHSFDEENTMAKLDMTVGMTPELKEKFEEAEKMVNDVTADNAKLKEESDRITAELKVLKEAYGEITPERAKSAVALMDAALQGKRDEAVRVYRLATGEGAAEAFEQIILGASMEQAEAFRSEYAKQADAKHPAHCAKCGSLEITRASSEVPPVPGGGKGAPGDRKLSAVKVGK